jgi:ABC-type antimicrobial peptide transport system permease subunit
MSDLVLRAHRSWRLGATMFLALGWLALAVASVGWFGLIRYNVAQRTHEIGVRAALGAGGRQILWLVIAPNLRLALLGIAAGCALALATSSWLQPLLFRQSATDPSAYAIVATLIAAVTLAACAMPAIRAAKAPPVRALRAE